MLLAFPTSLQNVSLRLQISTEAIAEFKVDTALYGAETGGTAGGQVELISKSGTNSFHGSAFEYLRNDALNTRGPFDGATLPLLRLNQYGASLGGPIRKNRTFFSPPMKACGSALEPRSLGMFPAMLSAIQCLPSLPLWHRLLQLFQRAIERFQQTFRSSSLSAA